jgi:hypothetical protein
MSEPAHLADMLACGGRHGSWAPAYGASTLLAAIAALAMPGEVLPVTAVQCDIQLIAAGPHKCAVAFRPWPIGHVAVQPISQP